MGEAAAALLTTQLAAACEVTSFVLKGDALLVVLAINHPLIFFPLEILLVFFLILT
jgi:hypothetical protein